MAERSGILAPYTANITVTFDGRDEPFKGRAFSRGDGSHALFTWPDQANTPERDELAEFETQTKWVTMEGQTQKSDFEDPDPNFVGMVSHAEDELVSEDEGWREYQSPTGVRTTYMVDEQAREVVSSIRFEGAVVEFDNVRIGPQDPSLFEVPS